MNVLLIGGGGREHALAWKIAQSPLLARLWCAPGSPGMAACGTCVNIGAEDVEAIGAFARANAVDLVVVGPEGPLALGLADRLMAEGIAVFGPSQAAAQLEASKGFTKDLCAAYDIPTAAYGRFSAPGAAKAYLETQSPPHVVKADGLAAGKGVVIAETRSAAEAAIDDMFAGAFGGAGAEVVIEEFMRGEEASFFALTDGETVLPLIAAQDHKRVGEGDTGPNTGGMGAYSPAPVFTPAIEDAVLTRIIHPTLKGMRERGAPYRGVLYAGLMITGEGPKLVEYNARFGDPEAQILMMRLKGDLLPALLACATGDLAGQSLEWRSDAAITVVMAAEGYPGAYGKGEPIAGIDAADADPDVQIFHAGTAIADGRLVSNGGRVLNICALGPDLETAAARAYAAVDKIDWPGGFVRRDIGWRALTSAR
ncbi:MAG: phosphoribosylamine--glycine ligase [Pseudomonadota bacterium]